MIPKRFQVGGWQIVRPCFTVILALALFAPLYVQGGGPTDHSSATQSDGLPVTVTGELTVLYMDDFDNQRGQFLYVLEDLLSSKRFNLRFQGEPPPGLQSGAVVTARGRAHQQELYLAADDEQSLQPELAAAEAAPGEQRILVMVADYSDDVSVSCAISEIQDHMFTDPAGNSVDLFYQTVSDGQIWFNGEVAGPFTIDYTSTEPCDYSAWTSAAEAAATADGYNVAAYARRVYVLPRQNGCGYSGLATVGGDPSRAWIHRCDLIGVYAHEIGHNLRLHHAATPSSDYGDLSDVMGYGASVLRGLNAPHQDQMDWHPPGQVEAVTQSGVYDIAPLELDEILPVAPQALTIPKPDSGDYYYLSYRQPYSYDGNLQSAYVAGVSVHQYSGDGSSSRTYLLDVLGDSESFVDAVNGITITQVSNNAEFVTVQVELDTVCVIDAPGLTLTPADQSGPAGATVFYTLTVNNRDSADCAPSTLDLTGSVPGGWTGALSPGSLTLAPGESASAVLTVTSDGGAGIGAYSVTVYASDNAEPAHTGSRSALYQVQAGTDADPPSAPSALSASTKRKQVQLSWSAATDNIGVAGYTLWRNGLALGQTTTIAYADRTISSGASYTYSVTAHDQAGNVSAECQPVTVTLSGSGGGNGGGGKDGGKGKPK